MTDGYGGLSDVDGVPAVLLAGPPASGKTTAGRGLARHLGAALLDLDTATAALVQVVADLLGTPDLDDPRLAQRTRGPRYDTLLALAEDNLRAGTPVVLVAPFTAERRDAGTWAASAARLQSAGGQPLLLWLRLDAGQVSDRLRARAAARDLAKRADPERVAAGLDLDPPGVPHVAVDAGQTPEAVLADLLAAVDRHRGRT